MKRIATLILASAILAGCASNPTKEQISSADFGSYPSDYAAIVKSQIGYRLKDPSSAIFNIPNQTPKKRWMREFDKVSYGYTVCFDVNAKNSYGGYVGSQRHYAFISNGTIVSTSLGVGPDKAMYWEYMKMFCAD
jgi:hypothetical protein